MKYLAYTGLESNISASCKKIVFSWKRHSALRTSTLDVISTEYADVNRQKDSSLVVSTQT